MIARPCATGHTYGLPTRYASRVNSTDVDIPKIQRPKSRTLAQWMERCENREQALYNAHTQSAMTMSAIAREIGLSVSRVSRLIARAEGAKDKA